MQIQQLGFEQTHAIKLAGPYLTVEASTPNIHWCIQIIFPRVRMLSWVVLGWHVAALLATCLHLCLCFSVYSILVIAIRWPCHTFSTQQFGQEIVQKRAVVAQAPATTHRTDIISLLHLQRTRLFALYGYVQAFEDRHIYPFAEKRHMRVLKPREAE